MTRTCHLRRNLMSALVVVVYASVFGLGKRLKRSKLLEEHRMLAVCGGSSVINNRPHGTERSGAVVQSA